MNDLTDRQEAALSFISGRLRSGIAPSIRDVMKALGFKSPRSAALIVSALIGKGYLDRGLPSGKLMVLKESQPPTLDQTLSSGGTMLPQHVLDAAGDVIRALRKVCDDATRLEVIAVVVRCWIEHRWLFTAPAGSVRLELEKAVRR